MQQEQIEKYELEIAKEKQALKSCQEELNKKLQEVRQAYAWYCTCTYLYVRSRSREILRMDL